jgi:hypothetical protein
MKKILILVILTTSLTWVKGQTYFPASGEFYSPSGNINKNAGNAVPRELLQS